MNEFDVYKIYDIPTDDIKTYNMLEQGKNLGVFQCESPLLIHWTKKLRPRSLDDLAVLVAAVRPGVLNAHDEDGRNMAQVICDRRNKVEDIKYFHPILERALKQTYGVLLYQESLMMIGEDVAGWSKLKGLDLQKAIAKKKAEKVAELKAIFIEDAVKCGKVTKEEATKIYESMEASARYLFNGGHSYEYGYLAYVTAYWKAQSTLDTFVARLQRSDSALDSHEEVDRLVRECISEDIEVKLPSILIYKEVFDTVDDNYIIFGWSNIKGVGSAHIKNIKYILEQFNYKDWTWIDWLVTLGHKITDQPKISVSIFKSFIESGMFDHLKQPRRKMVFELENFQHLTVSEQKWMIVNRNNEINLSDLLKKGLKIKKEGGAASRQDRIPVIQSIIDQLNNPPFEFRDTIDYILNKEKELLGISITYSKIDKFDTSLSNITLKQFSEGNGIPNPAIFAAEIVQLRKCVTKKGKNPGQEMAQLTLRDNTLTFSEVVIFPQEWEKYGELLYENGVFIIEGEADKYGKSLIVKRIAKLNRN